MKPAPLDDLDLDLRLDPANPDTAEAALRSIRAELAEGERLVWFGQPRRRPPTPGAPPLVLLAGVAAASVGMLVMLAGLISGPHPGAGPVLVGFVLALGGAALLLIGLRGGVGSGRLATAYALTDRRVIVRRPIPIGQVLVQSFRPNDLSRISRIERADGSGMIILEGLGRRPDGVQAPVQLASLVGLEGVREVETLIRATLLPD